jgi:Fur family ferric uptake transcriptional regulator
MVAEVRAEYVTRPREQITAILRAERRYLSAAEISERLKRDKAKVALSTVYRTLEHLQSKGEIEARVDEAGEATYVLCGGQSHHHHAICRSCGRIEDVDCGAVEQLAKAVRADNGFQIEDHAMEFFGRCTSCR